MPIKRVTQITHDRRDCYFCDVPFDASHLRQVDYVYATRLRKEDGAREDLTRQVWACIQCAHLNAARLR